MSSEGFKVGVAPRQYTFIAGVGFEGFRLLLSGSAGFSGLGCIVAEMLVLQWVVCVFLMVPSDHCV